jgi:hypothetical protein
MDSLLLLAAEKPEAFDFDRYGCWKLHWFPTPGTARSEQSQANL